MPETTDTQSEIIDLGFDVSEADVLRPVLQSGTYDFTIASTRKEPSRQKQIPQLLVVYRLAEPAVDSQGRTVNPGFTIIQRYLLQPTGGLTMEMIQRRIKEIHFAAAGEGKVTTEAWIGKVVRCRVNMREAHTDPVSGVEYGETNEIVRVMPKK